MKNKFTPILIIVMAVSLYYNFKLSRPGAPLSVNQEVSFEQKQKCAIYKKDIESSFEKANNEGASMEFNYFDRIFYSPKQNSCLYVSHSMSGLKAKDRYITYHLTDALSGVGLFYSGVVASGETIPNAQASFDELVRSYEVK